MVRRDNAIARARRRMAPTRSLQCRVTRWKALKGRERGASAAVCIYMCACARTGSGCSAHVTGLTSRAAANEEKNKSHSKEGERDRPWTWRSRGVCWDASVLCSRGPSPLLPFWCAWLSLAPAGTASSWYGLKERERGAEGGVEKGRLRHRAGER